MRDPSLERELAAGDPAWRRMRADRRERSGQPLRCPCCFVSLLSPRARCYQELVLGRWPRDAANGETVELVIEPGAVIYVYSCSSQYCRARVLADYDAQQRLAGLKWTTRRDDRLRAHATYPKGLHDDR